jgi:hypothetical protein
MTVTRMAALSATAVLATLNVPAAAQHLEGDARSPVERWGRALADPGTFWLDSNDDREIIRYSTPRDVRLCLPEPRGVNSPERGVPLRVTWDRVNSLILYPGNCLFFDARQVTVKPASNLPNGVVIKGRVEASGALVT